MAIVFPRVLYNSAGNTGTLSYGNEDADFPAENAVDWLSFSLWRITDSILTVTVSEELSLDSFAWFAAEGSATSVALEWDTTGAGAWATLATLNSPENKPILVTFAGVTVPAGRDIRIVITGATDYYVRQWAAGPVLIAERGQRGGLNPPTLNQGVVVNNNISLNGALVGRDYRQLTRRSALTLEHLSESWVRDSWEPFTTHALRKAFFYAWDLDSYPEEVTMAAAQNISAPTNMQNPNTMMQVTMPLENII